MRVSGMLLNGNTPVFVIPGPAHAPYGTVFGAVSQGAEWFAPAYYPFGEWVLRDLRDIDPGLTLEGDARTFAHQISTAAYAVRDAEIAFAAKVKVPLGVPEGFFPPDFPPYTHQTYGIHRIASWWRTWLQWDMGAGKTRTVLDGLRFLGDFKKLLVLGPPVVLDGWLRETRRVSGGAWKAVLWDGTPEAVEAARDAKVVVLSYARARIEANFDIPHPQLGTLQVFAPEKSRLLKLGYDVIVADESHNFGNPDSEQTKACLELSAGTARRYCLTGTPGDNPGKIYAQLHFLSPALLNMSWDKFKARYFIYSDTHQGVIGYTRLNELNAIVASISTRVKKADCDLDLPPLTVVDITFGLGPRQVLRYNEVVEDMRVTFRETMAGHLPVAQSNGFQLHNRAVAINKLLQIISGFVIEGTDTSICDACEHMEGCVENAIEPYTKKCQVVQKAPKMRVIRDMENPKLEVFKDLITQILESDPTNKVITWGIFKEELDAMQAVVHSLGVKSVRLDGKTTRRSGEVEDAINKDPSVRVLIGMMSAGVGLTLTTPNYMIYYSLPWLPLRYWQAMDRFNRPGQRRRMTVYRLLTSEGSDVVDRCVAGVLKFKDRVEATMVSRIACVQCNRMAACALDGTQPFRENCTYAAAVDRPITKVKTI